MKNKNNNKSNSNKNNNNNIFFFLYFFDKKTKWDIYNKENGSIYMVCQSPF